MLIAAFVVTLPIAARMARHDLARTRRKARRSTQDALSEEESSVVGVAFAVFQFGAFTSVCVFRTEFNVWGSVLAIFAVMAALEFLIAISCWRARRANSHPPAASA